MYNREGWHHGYHERDIPPQRNHDSRSFGDGYHNSREHENYGQYYNQNAREDRNYNGELYREYKKPCYQEYHEEQPSYPEYREPRGRGYHRGGHYNSNYQDFRGGSWSGHGRGDKFKKPHPKAYSYEYSKSYTKEKDAKPKGRSPKPVTPNPDDSDPKTVTCDSPKNMTDTKSSSCTQNVAVGNASRNSEENNIKPIEGGANPIESEIEPEEHCAVPSEEDLEDAEESNTLSEAMKIFPAEVKPEKTDVKTEKEDATKDFIKHSVAAICSPVQDTAQKTTTPLSVNKKLIEDIKQEEQLPFPIITGKRPCMEDLSTTAETEEKAEKRACKEPVENLFFMGKTEEIPLLDGWTDDVSSDEEVAGTSTQENSNTAESCGVSDSAHELRKAFILARKEEIELGFCQDCRTFAFVANALLKKDPSVEVAVTNALRSCLQDVAGRCVQEMTSFIDHYDKMLFNASDRMQNSRP